MTDTILIWGGGAIGGTLGAFMARAGEDVLLVDIVPEHVAAINENGLLIEGPVETFTQPMKAALPAEVTGKFKTVILAVKAQHTEAAIEALRPLLAEDGYVVSAQNGLNELTIGKLIGPERTIGCFVNFGADWLEAGKILLGNRGKVAIGELDGSVTDRMREVHRLFSLYEPDAELTTNIWGYLWGKMGYGGMLFATALTPASMSDNFASAKHAAVFEGLGREVMAVARARGVTPLGFNGFDPAAFMPGSSTEDAKRSIAAMEEHNRHTAKTHSGVWRDIAVRKRKTEVDAQFAIIIDLAKEAGVEAPITKRLVELVHEVENGRPQSWDVLDELLAACS
ncbi:2-dehydropantoate 2-reductase [Devosia sp. 1566]|uniref:ketopantoate reductase family protein n=1 Tax=Devosia sp. 1566 TaxID=2499144 RepID=UPI000FD83C48|nr:2-dehydropantoate 2-reductase [Devosia sp. 1566]